MANKKKNSQYTIVYVFGPSRCKNAYLDNKVLNRESGEFVKIGKTDYVGSLSDCTTEKLRETAIQRCKDERKTGISDWCDLYDVFLFPQANRENVDDSIRNLLCNDVYSLDNSKDEYKVAPQGEIPPGREFVYGVSRNHIRHAVESYCFRLVIASEDNKLEDIRTICKINAIMTDSDEDNADQNKNDRISTRENRDISMVLSPGDVVYLTDFRKKNAPVINKETGQQVEAVYVGNKKFSHNDEAPKFASPLAMELIKRYNGDDYQTINGNNCWMAEIEVGDKTIRDQLANLYDSIVSGSTTNDD